MRIFAVGGAHGQLKFALVGALETRFYQSRGGTSGRGEELLFKTFKIKGRIAHISVDVYLRIGPESQIVVGMRRHFVVAVYGDTDELFGMVLAQFVEDITTDGAIATPSRGALFVNHGAGVDNRSIVAVFGGFGKGRQSEAGGKPYNKEREKALHKRARGRKGYFLKGLRQLQPSFQREQP